MSWVRAPVWPDNYVLCCSDICCDSVKVREYIYTNCIYSGRTSMSFECVNSLDPNLEIILFCWATSCQSERCHRRESLDRGQTNDNRGAHLKTTTRKCRKNFKENGRNKTTHTPCVYSNKNLAILCVTVHIYCVFTQLNHNKKNIVFYIRISLARQCRFDKLRLSREILQEKAENVEQSTGM